MKIESFSVITSLHLEILHYNAYQSVLQNNCVLRGSLGIHHLESCMIVKYSSLSCMKLLGF